jgi:hypothetical protein
VCHVRKSALALAGFSCRLLSSDLANRAPKTGGSVGPLDGGPRAHLYELWKPGPHYPLGSIGTVPRAYEGIEGRKNKEMTK